MSADNPVTVIQGWSDILQNAIFMGQRTSPMTIRMGLSLCNRDFTSDNGILEKDHWMAIIFREKVWTLFITDKIHEYGSHLRQEYPWLLEFERDRIKDFPGAFSYFEHNPSNLTDILQAYSTLIDCEAVKRNLVKYLRRAVLNMTRSFLEFETINGQMSRLLRRFEKLQGVKEDTFFLFEYMNTDYLAIYEHCLRNFTHDKPGWFTDNPEYKEWKEIRGRIRQFIRLIPSCDDSKEVEDLNSCILSLRTKALAQSSAGRERRLQEYMKKLQNDKAKTQKEMKNLKDEKENLQNDRVKSQKEMEKLQDEKEKWQDDKKKLQNEKEKLQNEKEKLHNEKEKLQNDKAKSANEMKKLQNENEKWQDDKKKLQEDKEKLQEDKEKLQEDKGKVMKRLEVFDRTVTDMSYRHLLEMLPMARHAATGASIEPNPKSIPEWQEFWKEAWAAAERGKDGPLNHLYVHSNKRKRTMIEEEGGRLYGVLSANTHDFEQEYNIDTSVRDRIPGLILSALKPQNFTSDGDVDWDKEVRRFV